jgi:flagellar motor protein MotB
MARKKKCPEHVDHERWLVSYADFITLLFAFFVVMYATASINLGKYKVLSDSLYGAFSGKPRVAEPIQVGVVSKSPNLKTNKRSKAKTPTKQKIIIQKFTNIQELVGGKTVKEQKKPDPSKPISQAKTTSSSKKSQQDKDKAKVKSKSKNKDKDKAKSKQAKKANQKNKNINPTIEKSIAKGEKHLKKQLKVEPIKTKKKGMKSKEKAVMGKLMAKIAQKLKKQFSNLINKERVKIRHNNKFIAVELNNHFFFKKGDYQFNSNAQPVVGRLVDILNKYPNFPIIVEGHTSVGSYDESEILSPWELSSLRAAGLVHLLTDFSVESDRITASSFASFKPAYDNSTPRGRIKNRRTTILIKADPQNTEFLRLLKKTTQIDYDAVHDFTK